MLARMNAIAELIVAQQAARNENGTPDQIEIVEVFHDAVGEKQTCMRHS